MNERGPEHPDWLKDRSDLRPGTDETEIPMSQDKMGNSHQAVVPES